MGTKKAKTAMKKLAKKAPAKRVRVAKKFWKQLTEVEREERGNAHRIHAAHDRLQQLSRIALLDLVRRGDTREGSTFGDTPASQAVLLATAMEEERKQREPPGYSPYGSYDAEDRGHHVFGAADDLVEDLLRASLRGKNDYHDIVDPGDEKDGWIAMTAKIVWASAMRYAALIEDRRPPPLAYRLAVASRKKPKKAKAKKGAAS